LRGGAGGGGVGGMGGGGGSGEKWTKPCMHIWIIKEKWKKKKNCYVENWIFIVLFPYELLLGNKIAIKGGIFEWMNSN
jgi:hypothetical protein